MVDFRVDDTAPDHPKCRAAGLPALGLWAMAGAVSTRTGTDGWIPGYFVTSWPGGTKAAGALVKTGLWTAVERDGIPGYQFHDFLDYQRAAAKVDADRVAAKARMAKLRAGADRSDTTSSQNVRANKPRTFARTNAERSPNVRDSLSLSPSVQVEGVSPFGRHAGAHANTPPTPPRPAEKCPTHTDNPTTGPCGPCADARRNATTWDNHQRQRAAEQRSADARQRAADRATAVADCTRCDPHGYVGAQLCDHDPDSADRARRGRAAVQAALRREPPEPANVP